MVQPRENWGSLCCRSNKKGRFLDLGRGADLWMLSHQKPGHYEVTRLSAILWKQTDGEKTLSGLQILHQNHHEFLSMRFYKVIVTSHYAPFLNRSKLNFGTKALSPGTSSQNLIVPQKIWDVPVWPPPSGLQPDSNLWGGRIPSRGVTWHWWGNGREVTPSAAKCQQIPCVITVYARIHMFFMCCIACKVGVLRILYCACKSNTFHA